MWMDIKVEFSRVLFNIKPLNNPKNPACTILLTGELCIFPNLGWMLSQLGKEAYTNRQLGYSSNVQLGHPCHFFLHPLLLIPHKASQATFEHLPLDEGGSELRVISSESRSRMYIYIYIRVALCFSSETELRVRLDMRFKIVLPCGPTCSFRIEPSQHRPSSIQQASHGRFHR